MPKMKWLVVLLMTIASVPAALAASAGAVTWDTNGAATFNATGGPNTLSVDQGTMTTGEVLFCTNSANSITVTPTFAGVAFAALRGTSTHTCSVLGTPYTIECGFALTAQTWAAGPPATTTGILDQTCDMYRLGIWGCEWSSATTANYTNPSAPATGRLTVAKIDSSAGSCFTGDRWTFREETWTVTAAGGPAITRTA